MTVVDTNSRLTAADAWLSSRFDRRIRTLFLWAIPAHVVAIFLNAVTDGQSVAAFAHLAMASMAWIIVYVSRDGVRSIIFSHVYWMFSFTLYFYAVIHGQAASYGLGDPSRSALIALTSQSGLFLVFLLSRDCMPAVPEPTKHYRIGAMRKWVRLLFAIGVVGVLGDMFSLFSNAYIYALRLFLFVALAIRLVEIKSRFWRDPMVLIAAALLGYQAVSSNVRTDLFALVLLFGFAWLMKYSGRILTLRNVIIGYVAWRLLVLFSAISLSIRWARWTDDSLLELFVSSFFSTDTFLTVVNPFHVHSALITHNSLDQASFYSPFFTGGGDGIFDRLTILPYLDLVVARLEDIRSIEWSEILNAALSVLPSIGQQKDLIFSDVLTWELGLRTPGVIGRPLVTAEGELFAMGGYLAILLVLPICFLALHSLYRQICVITGLRSVGILICSQLFINTIFSTTVLSVLQGTIRTPILMIIALWLFLLGTRRITSSSEPKPVISRGFATGSRHV